MSFDKIVIATGSRIATIPSLNIGTKRLLNSTSALDHPAIPKSLLVIGGGYIGLELGSVYQALGSKVSVVEMLDGLLPGAERDLVSHLSKRLKGKFESIMLNSKVVEMKEVKDGIQVKIQDRESKTTEQTYDYVLMSIGRKPDTSGLGLENTKVKVNERGWIKVNNQMQTDDPDIYAIGVAASSAAAERSAESLPPPPQAARTRAAVEAAMSMGMTAEFRMATLFRLQGFADHDGSFLLGWEVEPRCDR